MLLSEMPDSNAIRKWLTEMPHCTVCLAEIVKLKIENNFRSIQSGHHFSHNVSRGLMQKTILDVGPALRENTAVLSPFRAISPSVNM